MAVRAPELYGGWLSRWWETAVDGVRETGGASAVISKNGRKRETNGDWMALEQRFPTGQCLVALCLSGVPWSFEKDVFYSIFCFKFDLVLQPVWASKCIRMRVCCVLEKVGKRCFRAAHHLPQTKYQNVSALQQSQRISEAIYNYTRKRKLTAFCSKLC